MPTQGFDFFESDKAAGQAGASAAAHRSMAVSVGRLPWLTWWGAASTASTKNRLRGEGNDMADDLPPWQQRGAGRRDCAPHRAHLLLRLGSVGFLLSLLSPLAVPAVLAIGLGAAVNAMGKRDLARMAVGRLDPAGAADTRRAWWGRTWR
jgi:hypothetical protein